ncbi:MAG: hypothetical protein ACJAWL_002858, partial [Motiliproteus sp.]
NSTTAMTVNVAAGVAQDQAGNDNTVADQSVQAVDTDVPSVAMTDDGATTATGAVTYTFTFSEIVNGFTVAEVIVTGGTKAGSFASGADGDSVYTLVVTPDANSTTAMTVNVAAGVAQDQAGNDNTVADQSVQAVDTDVPSVAITDDGATTENGAVTYTFTFSEIVNGFTVAEVIVTGGTKAGSFASGADGDSVFTLVVTPTADSTTDMTVDVAAGVAQDQAGNDNTVAVQSVQKVDTVAPTANFTAATDNKGSVTGLLSSGDTTDDSTLVLSGTNELGASVMVYSGGNQFGKANVTGKTWQLDAPIANAATYQFTVKETDAAGNVSAATTNFEVSGDMIAPTATLNSTSTSTKAQSSEVGTAYLVKSTVDVTSLANITDANVNLWNNVAITTADTDTPISTDGLDEGDYVLYTVDAAGNLSNPSSSIAVDPGPTLTSSTPNDEAKNVGHADDLVLTFNENIKLGTGNISIIGGDDRIEIDVANHNGQLTIVDDTLTIDPNSYLANNSTQYHVEIDAQAVTDMTNNAYAGIAAGDSETLNFETAATKTNVVVFDFVHGVSSSHNGGSGADRTFEANTEYTIYMMVDSNSDTMNTVAAGAKPGATYGLWNAENLDADDRVVLVGNGSKVIGMGGGEVDEVALWDMTDVLKGKLVWRHASDGHGEQTRWAFFGYKDQVVRGNTTTQVRVGVFESDAEDNLWNYIEREHSAFSSLYADTIPEGILASQGLV